MTCRNTVAAAAAAAVGSIRREMSGLIVTAVSVTTAAAAAAAAAAARELPTVLLPLIRVSALPAALPTSYTLAAVYLKTLMLWILKMGSGTM
jgi:hypothetical protein